MTVRVYVAGPMSGMQDLNFPAFHAVTFDLRRRGYTVANPAEGTVDLDRPWSYYMRRAIRALTYCDTIALLDGWERSRGARLEVDIGRQLDIPAVPIADMPAVPIADMPDGDTA